MFRNERGSSPSRSRWKIVGNRDCRRVAAFQNSLQAQGEPPALLIRYADLLSERTCLQDCLQSGDLVRLESAAESSATRRLLLGHGYPAAAADGYHAALPDQVAVSVKPESPEYKPRQLYLGYRRLLADLDTAIQAAGAIAFQAPLDVACMFDKWDCQNRLSRAGVPIPQLLARPRDYADARDACGENGRAMLKMSHGSGGVGCVAIHRWRGRVRAFVSSQTLAMIHPEFADSSLPVQAIQDESLLAYVINALCAEQAHLEAWLPKARFESKPFDLRVVVIAGKPRHAIARLGRSPFTNLNLGGQRRDIGLLEQRIGHDGWAQIQQIAAQVAGCFPQTLCFGLDLLMTPGGDFYALEVNAFGDFLLHLLQDGQDPYAAEIAAVDQWLLSRDETRQPTGASIG